MSGKQSNISRSSVSHISSTVLIRISSALVALLMLGHMSAYPWASTNNLQETQLVASMKSVDFAFMGERSTFWSLYYGWGVLVGVLLLALAIVLWLLSDMSHLAPRSVGAITGILAATCLAGAYISLHYFYLPPAIMFAVIFVILLMTTLQLLRQRSSLDHLLVANQLSE